MKKIANYRITLLEHFKKSIKKLMAILPTFREGEIMKEGEDNYIKLTYSAGLYDNSPTQKYLKLEIMAFFYEEEVELFYSLNIADDTRPFSWKASEKFKSEYLSAPSFDRWCMIKLREREEETKNKFSYLFENYVKILGTRGVTEPSKELFKSIIEGMIKLNKLPIIVIEITHIDRDKNSTQIYKPISFALFDWHDWLLFPDFCNEGDSGEGGGGYFELKDFLDKNDNSKLIIWHKDMPLDEFENKVEEYTPIKYQEYLPKKGQRDILPLITRVSIIDNIIREINSCFNEGLYLASGILIRKLIEESLIQKLLELNPDKDRKSMLGSGGNRERLDNEKIKEIVNDRHLIKSIKDIFELESSNAVHGESFSGEYLETEARVVKNFLSMLFPRDINELNQSR